MILFTLGNPQVASYASSSIILNCQGSKNEKEGAKALPTNGDWTLGMIINCANRWFSGSPDETDRHTESETEKDRHTHKFTKGFGQSLSTIFGEISPEKI